MAVRPYPNDQKDLDKDFDTEMAALTFAVAVFIVAMLLESYAFGALWLLVVLFAFGLWRIGKAELQ